MKSHRTLVKDRLTWHVVSRGWRGEAIFRDAADYSSFRELLGEKAEVVSIPILAYCLMPNHFHILLSAEGPALADFAKRIKVAHAMRFNRRHVGFGTLFEGRYASIPVYGARNLAYVSAYIHHNPVTAGIVGDPLSYAWSSAWETESSTPGTPWLDPVPVIKAVREATGNPAVRYADYLAQWARDRSAAFPNSPPDEKETGWVFERRVEVLRRFFGHLCQTAGHLTDGNPAARGLAVSFGVWITMHSGAVPAASVAVAAGLRGSLCVYSVTKRMRDWRSRALKYRHLARAFMDLWPEYERELKDLRSPSVAA